MPINKISSFSNSNYNYNAKSHFHNQIKTNNINFCGNFNPQKINGDYKILFMSLGTTPEIIYKYMSEYKNQIAKEESPSFSSITPSDIINKKYDIPVLDRIKRADEERTEDLIKLHVEFLKKYKIEVNENEFGSLGLNDFKGAETLGPILDSFIIEINKEIKKIKEKHIKAGDINFDYYEIIGESINKALMSPDESRAVEFQKNMEILKNSKGFLRFQKYIIEDKSMSYFDAVNLAGENPNHPCYDYLEEHSNDILNGQEKERSDYIKLLDANIELDNRVRIINWLLL